MPIRYLPDPTLSRDVSQSLTNRVKCLIYNTGAAERSTAALGHVRLPAAVPAEGPRRRANQGACRQAEAAGRLVDRYDHDRLVGGHPDDHHDRGPRVRHPAAYIERELADVVGFGAVRRPVRDHREPADVLGPGRDLGGRLE